MCDNLLCVLNRLKLFNMREINNMITYIPWCPYCSFNAEPFEKLSGSVHYDNHELLETQLAPPWSDGYFHCNDCNTKIPVTLWAHAMKWAAQIRGVDPEDYEDDVANTLDQVGG